MGSLEMASVEDGMRSPAGVEPDSLPIDSSDRQPASLASANRQTQSLIYWIAASLRPPNIWASLTGLIVFLCLFVGWDVLTNSAFPGMSTWVRHPLLTICAATTTVLTTAAINTIVSRHNRRLSDVAQTLTRLLHSHQAEPSNPRVFENPHLATIDERIPPSSKRPACAALLTQQTRCWHALAAQRAVEGDRSPQIELEGCLNCPVYRAACPDKLTELGEAFNNLLFLLRAEADKAGYMQSQLAEKEKMVAIGKLAAGIAHEVCNPLSSISSVVQMLRRRQSAAATPETLDLIDQHIQRITSTVRNLTTLAHPGVDRWDMVDVGACLDGVVRLIAFDRRTRGVQVHWQRPAAAVCTRGIRDQLQQVFLNLAINALDAMPDGGSLSFHVRQTPREIEVDVVDTGVGIPAGIGRRVFNPFFTTKPQGQGTGLGLSVSYGIVQKHQGRIDFRANDGKGTVFTVALPIRTEATDS